MKRSPLLLRQALLKKSCKSHILDVISRGLVFIYEVRIFLSGLKGLLKAGSVPGIDLLKFSFGLRIIRDEHLIFPDFSVVVILIVVIDVRLVPRLNPCVKLRQAPIDALWMLLDHRDIAETDGLVQH